MEMGSYCIESNNLQTPQRVYSGSGFRLSTDKYYSGGDKDGPSSGRYLRWRKYDVGGGWIPSKSGGAHGALGGDDELIATAEKAELPEQTQAHKSPSQRRMM